MPRATFTPLLAALGLALAGARAGAGENPQLQENQKKQLLQQQSKKAQQRQLLQRERAAEGTLATPFLLSNGTATSPGRVLERNPSTADNLDLPLDTRLAPVSSIQPATTSPAPVTVYRVEPAATVTTPAR